MSQEYDNTNRGALFRNDRKEKDSHPDHQGTINVEGVEYWLSAWVKTSKKGQKFFSLSVKPKEERAHTNDVKREATTGPPPSDFDDDIPF
jgi:hypothetical protein